MKKQAGFSLMEILIALIIFSILSAVCLPLYTQHIVHEKRLEGELNLIKLAAALEQFYTSHNTYENATLNTLGIPEKVAGNQYQLVIASSSSSDFSLNAIPQENQAKEDTNCGTLVLNSLGQKAVTGTASAADCWQ